MAVHSVSVNPITSTLVLAGEFAGTLNMGSAWTLTSQVRCSSRHQLHQHALLQSNAVLVAAHNSC